MTSIDHSALAVTTLERVLNGSVAEPGPLVVTPAGAVARRGRGDGLDPTVPARRQPPEPPAHVASRRQSSYLDYLPGVYLRNEFLGRFLLIFESILDPIDRQVATLDRYFDPDTAPSHVLKWLGSWLGLVVDDRLPEDRRRALVRAASEIFAWRGTRRGLALLVRTALGVEPEIIEPTLAEVTANPAEHAWRFTVRITVPVDEPLDDEAITALIDMHRPAAVAAVIQVTRK